MNQNKLIVKKHSAVIQISVKELSLVQRKLINALIYVAQNNAHQEVNEIKLLDLKKICNIGKHGNDELKAHLKSLADIKIEFNYLNKDKKQKWSYMSLLSEVEIEEGCPNIKFSFPPTMRNEIIRPRMYAPIDLVLISGIKSSYSIILYELLRDYLAADSIPLITITDLKSLMGVDQGCYKFFPNFERNVIKTAVNEINQKSDLNCSYELIKQQGANKYESIQFFVAKRAETLALEKNDGADFSMDLFDDLTGQAGKIAVQIPENILSAVPNNQRTEAVKTLLLRFLDKGSEFVISNIKYSLEKYKENFSAYLSLALENDYAGHDRELKAKTKENTVEKHRQIEKIKKAKQIEHGDHAEILKRIENLTPNELKPLHNKFDEIFMKSGIKPEFLTDTVRESLLIEAYRALNVVDAYSSLDQD